MVALTGMPRRSAYSIESSRVKPQLRTGASTSRSGASARVETSKRTWSLPLPVQPWATASAPWRRAASTRCFDDDRPRERNDQRVLALVERVGLDRAGHEVRGELRPQVEHLGLDGPGRERPLPERVPVASLAEVRATGDDLGAQLLDHPAHATDVSSPPL